MILHTDVSGNIIKFNEEETTTPSDSDSDVGSFFRALRELGTLPDIGDDNIIIPIENNNNRISPKKKTNKEAKKLITPQVSSNKRTSNSTDATQDTLQPTGSCNQRRANEPIPVCKQPRLSDGLSSDDEFILSKPLYQSPELDKDKSQRGKQSAKSQK